MAKPKANIEEPKALTLRDVAADYRAWADTLDGIEDPADKEKALEAYARSAVAGREKVDAFVAVIRRLRNEADFATAEASRLADRAKAISNGVERMEAYALQAINENALGTVEGNVSKLRSRPSPASCRIDDEAKVPTRFKTVTVKLTAECWETIIERAFSGQDAARDLALMVIKADVAIDKTAVKKAITAGHEIDGADLDTSGTWLEVI